MEDIAVSAVPKNPNPFGPFTLGVLLLVAAAPDNKFLRDWNGFLINKLPTNLDNPVIPPTICPNPPLNKRRTLIAFLIPLSIVDCISLAKSIFPSALARINCP